MLLSMTGFGESHQQANGLAVVIEVRTINNRYFKFSMRAGEGYSALESRVEAVVREHIKRGTVQVNLQVDRSSSPDDYSINVGVLENYRQQIQKLQSRTGNQQEVPLENFLLLPGVVKERLSDPSLAEADWPVIETTLQAALGHLAKMRRDEGQAMAADLSANCRTIAAELKQIAVRAPSVVDAYRVRLEERVRNVLEEHKLALNASDLVREIAIYTERSNIAEEMVRLESHLQQFEQIMSSPESAGRKLEFLTQEMLREVNTIGSKSTDVEIARHVIEMKASIERLREMIQNVE
ncbi:MAG TPA: YicC/YloC family endoribonuclease [Pirellulales bacterium]|nr:YicC/YloC family endoribonuclease [Pirellulales bacterium]